MTTPTAALRVHHVLAASRANGPGLRAVVWLQGCARRCAGCFNPETHDPAGGAAVRVPALLGWLARLAPGVDGVTISGGEPLEQAESLRPLLEAIRGETGLSALLFTGWSWADTQASAEAAACVRLVDAVVTGRFVGELASAASQWGSSNQELRLVTERWSAADFAAPFAAEVWVAEDGSLVLTGLDPPTDLLESTVITGEGSGAGAAAH
jgi:anaerobic ribonucleoside-triphosphate reductase activating protein